MKSINYDGILKDLRRAGIERGDTLFVQSALSPLGYVEGGAKAVAYALLEAVGEEGTLCAPAFCFAHETQKIPIIDPDNDKSEMGAISEEIRLLPGAKRSIAYRHSVSAVGRNAEFITNTDPCLSVFDIRSSFGRLLAVDAKVLLLGVPYLNSTSHHFAEYILKVPDRQTVEISAKIRKGDGTLLDATLTDYQPKPNENGEYYSYPHDFNRSGRMLEQLGLVTIQAVGNAIARMFKMRDLIHLFIDHYAGEYNMFAVDNRTNEPTILPDGEMVLQDYLDAAGRVDTAVWCCVSAADRVPSRKNTDSRGKVET